MRGRLSNLWPKVGGSKSAISSRASAGGRQAWDVSRVPVWRFLCDQSASPMKIQAVSPSARLDVPASERLAIIRCSYRKNLSPLNILQMLASPNRGFSKARRGTIFMALLDDAIEAHGCVETGFGRYRATPKAGRFGISIGIECWLGKAVAPRPETRAADFMRISLARDAVGEARNAAPDGEAPCGRKSA